MTTHNAKPAATSNREDDFKDRLIPFPGTAAHPMVAHHSLRTVLARNVRNPLVRFVRSVFFYPNDTLSHPAPPASPNHGGVAYFPTRTLAH
jgi:hypothetical protein